MSYDIGPDGVGRLYLVESGGFGSRMIYEVREPDPDRDQSAELLGREPVHGGEVSSGDNVEAGDFLPAGGCRLVLIAESRTTYVVGAR